MDIWAQFGCEESFISDPSTFQVVKNGVAQAQEELRKEADNQIWQEGILRFVIIKTIKTI